MPSTTQTTHNRVAEGNVLGQRYPGLRFGRDGDDE